MRTKQPIVMATFLGVAIIAASLAVFQLTKSSGQIGGLFEKNHDKNTVSDQNLENIPNRAPWLKNNQATSTSANLNLDTHTAKLAASTLDTLINSQSSDKVSEIDQNSDSYIKSLATDDLYTVSDINISPNESQATLKAYGNRIAMIIASNAVAEGTEGEVEILAEAVNNENPAVLTKLEPIIISYEGMVDAMLKVSVPQNLINEHLYLTNSFQALANDIGGMREVVRDPVLALVRIRRYESDAIAMYEAISNLYSKLDQAGIKWSKRDPVSSFIRINN